MIREPARIMRELGQAKKTQFLEAQVGQVREVLVVDEVVGEAVAER